MKPGSLIHDIYGGDTYEFVATVGGAAAPVDLTGATIVAQIRKERRKSPVYEPALAAFEVTNTPGPDGRVVLLLTDEESSKLIGQRKAVWDMQVTFPPVGAARPVVRTYVGGDINVDSDVSANA